jgi:phosphatidylinositol alpha-mannosyltransferase
MKVALVSQSYHPRPGGVTEHVHHTAVELRRRGHDVTIITANFDTRSRTEPGVVRIGRNVLVPINGAWVNMTVGRRLADQMGTLLRALNPDVIHTHCPLVPTLPLIALRVAPPRTHIVGTFHAAADRSPGYQFFQKGLARYAERLDTRIAVSEAALRLAHSYFPGPYEMLPNGVDNRRFSPRVEPIERYRDGSFNILFVGRMDKRKGLKYLFHAAKYVRKAIPGRKLRLLVVGDNGLRRHLLPRVPRDVEVVFTGVVDKDVLPRYFASGDVFCSPAVDRESFGIVLLEAMASGIPVIGTGIPGYLTILKDRWNSLVVKPRDPHALANAIVEALSDERLRWTLRSNGVNFARAYAWSRIVDQLEAIYTRGLGEPWDASPSGEPREMPEVRDSVGAHKA